MGGKEGMVMGRAAAVASPAADTEAPSDEEVALAASAAETV